MNQFGTNPWGAQGGSASAAPPSFRIQSFTSSITVAEKGTSANPALSWAYLNGTPVSQDISGIGSIPNAQRTVTVPTPITDTTSFTLTASDGIVSRTAGVTTNFYYPIYIGDVVSAAPSEPELLAMTKKVQGSNNFSHDFIIENARTAIAIHSSIPLTNFDIKESLFNLSILSSFTKYENVNLTTNAGVQPYTVFIFNTLQHTSGQVQKLNFNF